MLTDKVKGVIKVWVIIIGVGYFGIVGIGRLFGTKPVDTTVAVESTPAEVVRKTPRVAVTMKASPKAYAPEAKANLKLPAAVIADPDKQVLSATTIRSSEHPQTVSTVIDANTGESKTYVKQEPLPWAAAENRGEVRIDYGYKFYGTPVPAQVARLSIHEDVIQVKGFHLGVNASIDTDREAFVGVGIGYRW